MSTTWIALLRGINLGKNRRVAMADLRSLLESLEYDDVRTLLQSGNAVFTTGRGKAADLEKEISAAIEERFGMAVDVLVRSSTQLASVVEANPFAAKGVDAKELHAAFLSATPAKAGRGALDPAAYAPDEYAFGDRVVYLRRPNGIKGQRLPDWARVLDVSVTERNWNTVTKLRDLSQG